MTAIPEPPKPATPEADAPDSAVQAPEPPLPEAEALRKDHEFLAEMLYLNPEFASCW